MSLMKMVQLLWPPQSTPEQWTVKGQQDVEGEYWLLGMTTYQTLVRACVHTHTHTHKISSSALESSMGAKISACFVHCSVPNASHIVSSPEIFEKWGSESSQLKGSGISIDLVLIWRSNVSEDVKEQTSWDSNPGVSRCHIFDIFQDRKLSSDSKTGCMQRRWGQGTWNHVLQRITEQMRLSSEKRSTPS